ncbi:hypothetical protein GN956_G10153 [Arapaima gigas]
MLPDVASISFSLQGHFLQTTRGGDTCCCLRRCCRDILGNYHGDDDSLRASQWTKHQRFHLNDDPHRLKLRLRIGVFCWRRPEVLLKETTHHQDCD